MNVLEREFLLADQGGYNYLAVEVSIADTSVEYIVIRRQDYSTKLKYYKNAYTEELALKTNNNVRITDVAYGNTFDDIERNLMYGA